MRPLRPGFPHWTGKLLLVLPFKNAAKWLNGDLGGMSWPEVISPKPIAKGVLIGQFSPPAPRVHQYQLDRGAKIADNLGDGVKL
jgi:hypothetical protein